MNIGVRARKSWGSAGILPAAAGMLPVAFSHVAAPQFKIRFQRELKLSGRMPDIAGNMPALPFDIHDSRCNGTHADRTHI